jgi:hypothetical protein
MKDSYHLPIEERQRCVSFACDGHASLWGGLKDTHQLYMPYGPVCWSLLRISIEFYGVE